MRLSVVVPAYNEAESLSFLVKSLSTALITADIDHEILIINDNSKDNTIQVMETLLHQYPSLRMEFNPPPYNGFGFAVRKGLENFKGDCVAIFMADLSDSPKDLVAFYEAMKKENCDCVFGSRFVKGGRVKDYPTGKLIINRVANFIIRASLGIRYNDATNAFKLYKKSTIEGLKPFLSPHFNLTIELPLKAIVRGYSYIVLPNSWENRKHGEAKLKIREMGSRYFFILLYVLIEKYFSKGDFNKKW